ncbi:hypothetical protein Tco_1148084 [Tanacetum coccineum]
MNIDHLNGLIKMMESIEFTLEIYNSVWCLREMVKAENKRILGLNKHLVEAEEDIKAKEGYLEILEEAIYSHKGGLHTLMYSGLINDSTLNLLEVYYAKLFNLVLADLEKEHGLKLIHTDNDVHSFFADAELNEEDAGLRCYSSSPFTTRIKKGEEKKGKEVGRTLIDSCDKGKEKVDEFPAATPTKEHQVVVTNYKRAIVNRKAKMVEVVAPVQENVDVGIK